MPFARLLGTLAVLTVLGACHPPPEGSPLQLPDLELLETTEGAPYEVSLGATGGTPPLMHSLEKLPPGFSFYMSAGLLKGPATVSGEYTFTVRVQDAKGATDTKTYRLLVHPVVPAGGDGGTTDGGGGTGSQFSAANWNLEWFGDSNNGPTNEALQLDNVKTVISTTGADFWALEELVDSTQFNALKQGLPGYDGFMANDPSIPSSSYYYAPTEQKVGFLYRPDVVSVRGKQLILTANNYDFGTRPPLRVDLTVMRDGTSVDLVAIVLHMKAYADSTSCDRRKNASLALKSYLDTQLPDTPFIVLGDWNDDVDVSICKDSATNTFLPSPYQNFLDDPADYTFVTQPLSLANQGSTVSHSQFIDHQLVSNELLTSYVSNSAQLLRPDTSIPQYGTTTSDHYPVLSRFALDGGTP